MRQLLLLHFFCALAVCGFSQTILFNQTSSITNSGTVAQDFEAINNTFDCMGADDFEVPIGETWYVDSLLIYGFYAAQNNDPFTTVSGISLIIYNDNGGTVGSIVYSDTVDTNVDANQDGFLTYHWTTPLALTAGTYWVAAAARKDFGGGGGQWYWLRTTTGFGNDFLWQNPGNGFALGCTAWSGGGNCLTVTEDGLAFRLYGCYSPIKPLINNLPEDTTFCGGPVLNLNASSPSQDVVFVWNTGQQGSAIAIDSSGYYRVWAIDTVTECGAYSDIGVTVLPAPDPGLEDSLTCDTFLFLNAFVGGSESYLWNDGSTGVFYQVTQTETVSVTVTDTITGCSFMDTAFIQVSDFLDPVLNEASPYGLCEGDTLTLATLESYDSYLWSDSSATASIIVTDSGTYSVTVANSLGCTEETSIDVIKIPVPVVMFSFDTLSNGSIVLQGPGGYPTYEWNTGDSTRSLIVNESGTYTLTVFDESGCFGSNSTFLIIIGIEELLTDKNVTLFPNPTRDFVTLTVPTEIVGVSTAEIVDVTGKVVSVHALDQTQNTLDVSSLAKGYYTVKVSAAGAVLSQPLLVD